MIQYGKKESTVIAGIAILLMYVHHMFGFPDYMKNADMWHSFFSIFGFPIEFVIAQFSKICVALYAFNTGYAMYVRRTDYQNRKNRLLRISKFLLGYWLCYFTFILYGIITGVSLPSLKEMALNLFGLNCSTYHYYINVPFAWYVSVYVISVLISPLVIKIFNAPGIIEDLVTLFSLRILLSLIQMIKIPWFFGLQNDLWPIFIMCGAFLTAKYQLIDKIHKYIISKMSLLWIICSIIFIISIGGYMRITNHAGSISDFLIALIFISLIVELLHRYPNNRIMLNIFTFLGINSMMLWYLQGIFFTGTKSLQDVVYFSSNPIISLLTALIFTSPFAIILKWVSNQINKQLDIFLNKKLIFPKLCNKHQS